MPAPARGGAASSLQESFLLNYCEIGRLAEIDVQERERFECEELRRPVLRRPRQRHRPLECAGIGRPFAGPEPQPSEHDERVGKAGKIAGAFEQQHRCLALHQAVP
jgi:hypothetical protein